MKRKVLIVSVVLWIACTVGGGMWGSVERYVRARSIPPGQLEVENLKDLYGAKLFDEVLSECDRADRDPRYIDYLPQITYIRWATDQRLGRTDRAEQDKHAFLQHFPNQILGADMHFNTAMNLLALANYRAAEDEFKLIQRQYPGSAVSGNAGDILGHLCASATTTSVSHQH